MTLSIFFQEKKAFIIRSFLKKRLCNRTIDYITPNVVEKSLEPLTTNSSVLNEFVKKLYERNQTAQDRVRNAINNLRQL